MNNFEVVIGLEVHTQLKTESKIFCSCPTRFDSLANENICPVCCGYPGVLPVFNQRALELAIRVAIALECEVNSSIYFERKNYFYPDLPKGYQISQFKMPLGKNGQLELFSGKKVRINRVHLEEDAGKLIHKSDHSLVDYNRTGTPLLEIVSEPDISSPDEAFDYLSNLKLVLQYIGASDCDMEKGSLRCDANISLREKGFESLGVKVELKNMNTFKGVRTALKFEAKRQGKCLSRGDNISQETRLWDADKLKTSVMRTKEEAHDYRYFPEPDLLDFFISVKDIDKERQFVGELPLAKRKRFIRDYQIGEKEVQILTSNLHLADFFESVNKIYPKAQEVSNWILGPYLEYVNNSPSGYSSANISVDNFAKIVRYFSEGKMNNLAAKKAFSLCIESNKDVDKIIEEEELTQVSNKDELKDFIEETINQNKKAIDEYLSGKGVAIMFLVGQVMKKTKGKANPKIVKEMLERRIKE